MGARRDGMQDVELVELHEGRDDAGPDESPAVERRPSVAVRGALRAGRWARRRWPVLAAAVVVLALVVGGVRVQQARAERAYLASIAGMPGILEPLDASTSELWRVETGSDLGMQWQAVGDLLVGATQTPQEMRVLALDASTGAVRWEVLAPVEVDANGYASPSCVTVEGASAALVCVTGSVWVVDEDGVGSPSATQREVVVVDVDRGELVGRHDVGTAMGLAPVGEGVVIVETQPDGHVRGILHDPATWEEIWIYDGAVPAAPTDVPSESDVQFSDEPRVVAADGRVAISDRSGAIAVLSEAGEILDQLPGVGVDSWLFAAGGRILRIEWSASGEASTVLDLVSGRTFGNGGLIPTTSDGSLGVRLLAGDDQGFRLVDLDSGEDVALDVPESGDTWAVFLVRGQVLLEQHSSDGVTTEAVLAAYDGTTGELRWRTALGGTTSEYPVYTAQLTDGRHVLVVEVTEATEASADAATPEWRLVAIDTTDGHRAWDIPLPEDVVQLVELGGRLYGMGAFGEVVALG